VPLAVRARKLIDPRDVRVRAVPQPMFTLGVRMPGIAFGAADATVAAGSAARPAMSAISTDPILIRAPGSYIRLRSASTFATNGFVTV
jgi:hypothetical protein